MWLSADLVAYFGHAVGSKVHEPIMSDGGEAAHAAAKCMLYSEGGTTGAFGGHVGLLPLVSEAESILKVSLVECEFKLLNWECT